MARVAGSEDPWNPTKYFLFCPQCDGGASTTQAGAVLHEDPQHPLSYRTVLVACDKCGEPQVLIQTNFGDGWDEPVRLWPDGERPLNPVIPEELREEHRQARLCLQAKAYTAAVVMIRRTLEGVCSLHEINSRNLVDGLRKLRETGKLDERLFEWANALRVLGNEGAHYTGKKVSRDVAVDAVEFCEAMLDNMYVLTERFEDFKRRRLVETADAEPAATTTPSP